MCVYESSLRHKRNVDVCSINTQKLVRFLIGAEIHPQCESRTCTHEKHEITEKQKSNFRIKQKDEVFSFPHFVV